MATFTGQLLITTDNEIRFSIEAHQLAVTSLEWLSPTSIISASLDGTVVMHLLKANSLERQCSLTIRVSDLPRKIRKSNASSRPTGITSLCVIDDTVLVASETGAIWSVGLPDLTRLMTIACEMEGIERLMYCSPYLLVITPSAKAKLLTQDGQRVRVLEWGLQMACCEPTGGLLFCGNNEEIICCDIRNDAQQSTHYNIPTIMFAIDNEKQLINVDQTFNVNIYKLIYE
ncbi:unnamed protein product [Anisakis simplex]|uniref:WD_REPEATS_REGION domain-containing protein n=1 Tax=Anisakis simplex TaxID=6269 RepID=A0A0M3K5I2_ANISI|nr:unnamed protein product [Anisakis simplex]